MVDRNWQFSPHFLLLLWQIVGATTIAPTLGAILSLWFVTVFAKSIHIPRLLYTHKKFVCCQFMPESSIHPEQYRVLPLLDQSWRLFPVGGKMPFFTRKFGTGYSNPAVLCGCFCSPPPLQYDAHTWSVFDRALGLDHCDWSREQTCSSCSMAAFLSLEVSRAGCETWVLDPVRHSDQILLKICIGNNVGAEATKFGIQNSFIFQLSA